MLVLLVLHDCSRWVEQLAGADTHHYCCMRALNTLETAIKANGADRADTPIRNGV